jgi:hypothetical protein
MEQHLQTPPADNLWQRYTHKVPPLFFIMGRSEQASLTYENLHSPIQDDDILPLHNVTQHPHQTELSYFSSEILECTLESNDLKQDLSAIN